MRDFRILHVEDDNEDADIIGRLLEGTKSDRLRVSVRRCQTGEETLRLIKDEEASWSPDLILMDLQLSKEGEALLRNNEGEHVIQRIRSHFSKASQRCPRIEVMTKLGKNSPQWDTLVKAGFDPVPKDDFRLACTIIIERAEKWASQAS